MRKDEHSMLFGRRKHFYVALLVMVLSVLAVGCGGGEESSRYQNASPRDPAFAMLDEYGSWIDLAPYGQVWSPWVSYEWRPYAYGHWSWSRGGWVWVGYEPFAWVVYHYGFWDFDRQLGWVWIPGYEWSPANVAWCTSDEYMCWAPLPPSNMSLIQPGDLYWEQLWVVVPAGDFTRDNVAQYRATDGTLRDGSKVRNGDRRSPDPRDVERRTKRKVDDVQVRDEKVRKGGRELIKISLPPEESKRVDAQADVVRRNLLRDKNSKEQAQPGRGQAGERDERKPVVPRRETSDDVAPPVQAIPRERKADEQNAPPVQTPPKERKVDERSAPPRPPERMHRKTETQQPSVVTPKPPKQPKKTETPPQPVKQEKKERPAPPKKEEPKPSKEK
jgi:hypothetical protein